MTKFIRKAFFKATFAVILASPFAAHTTFAGNGRPNVLFIAVDDLRPELAPVKMSISPAIWRPNRSGKNSHWRSKPAGVRQCPEKRDLYGSIRI